ncbi:MAG: hypothetical protein ABI402_03025 [Ferruginibacter sp.]
MKKQSQTLFNQISKTSTDSLNAMGETTVKGLNNGHVKMFSSADLWNIQRQRRSIVIR